MKNTLFQKDIISTEMFTRDDIALIFECADEMRTVVEKSGGNDILRGKVLAALFYEPSSRTFASFITAMQRLGGGIIPLNGMKHTSVAKGETLEDTVGVFEQFSDVIVIRHPESGAAAAAARASSHPVINAGDGPHEHPTQALLDVYTIHQHFRSIDDLTITLVGDLLYGRTVHSLMNLLFLYHPKTIVLVSPSQLKMPAEYNREAKKHAIAIHETDSLDSVVGETDVLYVTRVQKERFDDLSIYKTLKHRFVIGRQTMKLLKKDAVLMHPLPRVGEIASEVDDDTRSIYLSEQVKNGVYVRMALLSLLVKK
jgi:aspartate carbamoyltransferase catalytic subunit